jgi:REP element-mobilizing transposase RayT
MTTAFVTARHSESMVERFDWRIHASWLMGNHYRLLTGAPQRNLSRGMRWLDGVYTQCFNRRNERVGRIIQGGFTRASRRNLRK